MIISKKIKNILSILLTLTLIGTSTTSLISCDKPSANNENNKLNKPIKTEFITQQPPKNSSWKLVNKNNFNNEFAINNNKWYLFVNLFDANRYGVYLAKNNGNISNGNISSGQNNRWDLETYNPKDFVMFSTANIKNIYRFDGENIPEKPEINSSTGEIINWK